MEASSRPRLIPAGGEGLVAAARLLALPPDQGPPPVLDTSSSSSSSPSLGHFQPDHLPSDALCPITLESLPSGQGTRTLACGHSFKEEAIRTWLMGRDTCPVCREPVQKQAPPTPTALAASAGRMLASSGLAAATWRALARALRLHPPGAPS